jgi:hypothetical protein
MVTAIVENAAQNRKKMSWQLVAIVLVTLVPIVAAYVVYFTGVGVPQSRVNEGVLLEPARNLSDVLPLAQGDKPELAHNLLWRLIIPIPATCDQVCQRNLYITRQVHIRLGDKADRVERYAVNIGGSEGAAFLQSIAAEHPGLKSFSVAEDDWHKWLAGTNMPVSEHAYLLVDQVGFAMMFYSVQHDGNQLLNDVKRVLRYSPGG